MDAMLVCAICSEDYPYHRPCDQAHPDLCHWCAAHNLTGGYDSVPHPAPRETPGHWLSRRELAAVSAYMRHVVAVTGTGPLTDLLVTEDGA